MKRPEIKESLGDINLAAAHKVYADSPKLFNHVKELDKYIDHLEDELNKLSVGSVVFSEAELGCSFCGTNDGLKHGYMSNGNRCPRYKPN